MELYQAEWCPGSHRVRQRLTELGCDVTLRQVPANPDERNELRCASGQTSIPVLVADDGWPFCGDDQILEHLDRYPERHDAERHRKKALEEVPDFVELKAAA
jgi:glutathione S-transferase